MIENIPDKLYFKIGEVARITGVKPYVLRYWESEFYNVRPEKSPSRQRLYQKKDIELLAKIKQLLYDEKYTIAGAKRRLRELSSQKKKSEAKIVDTKKKEQDQLTFKFEVERPMQHTEPMPAVVAGPTKEQIKAVKAIRAEVEAIIQLAKNTEPG